MDFRLIYPYQILETLLMKKEWWELFSYKRIMANTTATWQHAARSTTNYHLLAAKQELYQKAYLLTKNMEELFEKESQKNEPVRRIKTRQKEQWL